MKIVYYQGETPTEYHFFNEMLAEAIFRHLEVNKEHPRVELLDDTGVILKSREDLRKG